MTERLLIVGFLSIAATMVAPTATQAQTFKVEKFDIRGEGGTDYVSVDSATGRVFVSRATHVMVVEGASGKVVADIARLIHLECMASASRPKPVTASRQMAATRR
jgi:hypothetical protein